MNPQDPQARQQIADRLKTANNVLVTVSNSPSVDQLAAAIGFTLLLNKMGKHGTAVFSGQVPSTIEFLKPEETLEKNTDSLRDFIVALDKSKADRLRYKVEDKVVKIFITPYRTSLSEKDLEFSQGDFNVDVVVALGVAEQGDLDGAITAHGRILHDATVVAITNQQQGKLGTINWNQPQASSLSELVVSLSEVLGNNLVDAQIATALLTGIVAETNRFSNNKTSPTTMTYAARLMSAGANQQLIASKLKESEPEPKPAAPGPPPKPSPAVDKPKPVIATQPAPTPSNDGALKIDHGKNGGSADSNEPKANDQIDIDTQGTLHRLDLEKKKSDDERRSRMILEPPTLKSQLTANTETESLDPTSDPLSATLSQSPILTHTPPASTTPMGDQTLSQIEESVEATHTQVEPSTDAARNAVQDALQASVPAQSLQPIQALNAQHVDLGARPAPAALSPNPTNDLNLPSNLVPPAPQPLSMTNNSGPATPPPPVPPPMMPPPFGQPPDDMEDVPPTEPLAAL